MSNYNALRGNQPADSANLTSTAAASHVTVSVSVACPAATALAAFLSGALATALGHPPVAGNVFVLTSAQDTSDTAFATAKGSAVSAGDAFVVSSSAADVSYVPAVSTSIGGAFAAIAAYLSSPPNTPAARNGIQTAIQKFNDLVAAVNAVSA